MPVALRASGMAEDALVLQHKLSTRTLRRGLTSNISDNGEEDRKRGEEAHGCVRGLSLEVRKTANSHQSLQRRSVRAAGTLADRYEAL